MLAFPIAIAGILAICLPLFGFYAYSNKSASSAASASPSTDSDPIHPHARILLFDGVCNVCNAFVNFIMDHDPLQRYYFASLQSPLGQKLIQTHNVPPMDSMILMDNAKDIVQELQTINASESPDLSNVTFKPVGQDNVYWKSSAAITIIETCGFPYSLIHWAIYLPAPVRDFGYETFASMRYKLFGQSEACRLMTKTIKKRFLEISTFKKVKK